jgi:hypothetical protein
VERALEKRRAPTPLHGHIDDRGQRGKATTDMGRVSWPLVAPGLYEISHLPGPMDGPGVGVDVLGELRGPRKWQ